MEEQKVSDNEIDKFIDKWKEYTPDQQKKNVESNEYFFPQIIKAMGPTNSRIEEIWASTSVDIQTSKILQMTELLKQNSTTLLAVWEKTHAKVKDEKMVEVISIFGNDSSMAIDLWERVPADLQAKEMPAILNSGMSNSLKMNLVKNSPVSVQRAVARNTPELAKAYGITFENINIYPVQTGNVTLNSAQDARDFLRGATAEQQSMLFRENPGIIRDIFMVSSRDEIREIMQNMTEEEYNNNINEMVDTELELARKAREEGRIEDAEQMENEIGKIINDPKTKPEKKEELLENLKEKYPKLYEEVMKNDAVTFELAYKFEKSTAELNQNEDKEKDSLSALMIDFFLREKLSRNELKELGYTEKENSTLLEYNGSTDELIKKFKDNPKLTNRIVTLEQSEDLLLNMKGIYENWDEIYEKILLERLYQNGQLGGEKITITVEQTLKTWEQISGKDMKAIDDNENLKFKKEVDYEKVNEKLVLKMTERLEKASKTENLYKKQVAVMGAVMNVSAPDLAEIYNLDLDEVVERRAREEVMKELSGDESSEMIEEKVANKKKRGDFKKNAIKREIVGEISEEEIKQEALYAKKDISREELINKVYLRKFNNILAENAQIALEYYRDKDKLLEELDAHRDEFWKPEEKEETQEIPKPEEEKHEETPKQEIEENLEPKIEKKVQEEEKEPEGKSLFDDLCSDDKTKTQDVQKGKDALEKAKEIAKQNLQEQEMADDATQNNGQEGIGIDE